MLGGGGVCLVKVVNVDFIGPLGSREGDNYIQQQTEC